MGPTSSHCHDSFPNTVCSPPVEPISTGVPSGPAAMPVSGSYGVTIRGLAGAARSRGPLAPGAFCAPRTEVLLPRGAVQRASVFASPLAGVRGSRRSVS